VAVGVAVPSSVRVSALPDTIVSIVPQYRGYSYFVTGERIAIVEPSSHKIVEVLPFEGGGRAAAAPAQRRAAAPAQQRSTASAAPAQRRPQFSSEQRATIKQQAVSRERTTERATTTGSGSSRRYVIEERVPREVELEEADDVVVREVPTARSYRYLRSDDDVMVVEPRSRRVLDIID
jgi:hypothetical protein